MPRALSTFQFNNVAGTTTRPIYAVSLNHNGTIQYYSTAGPITLDAVSYSGGIEISSIKDGASATLRLPASFENVDASVRGVWRGRKSCKITAILADNGDSTSFTTAVDGVLLIDGFINTSSVSKDGVVIEVVQLALSGLFTPKLTTNEISPWVPKVNTVFKLDTDSYYILKSRR
jgi:hypothetical protein